MSVYEGYGDGGPASGSHLAASGTPEGLPPRPGRGLLKRSALGALAIVLLTAAAVATAALLQVKGAVDAFLTGNKPIAGIAGVLDGVQSDGPQTVLLLGSDKRYAADRHDARSDTMLLVHLDPSRAATVVLSVPRDLKVRIPEPGHTVVDKVNRAFQDGGPVLAVETVRRLLGIPINHVLTVNFAGFREIVDKLGCVYADVDRRYYHSNAGVPPSEQYAEINIQPGYQQLCGQQALDYVRYRHADTDLVRNARQQDFLRQAKQQIGLGQLLSDREELLRIVGRYTQTDIRSNEAVLRLLKLVLESAPHPVQEIRLRVSEDNTPQGDYLVASRAQIRSVVRQFLGATERPRPAASRPASGAAGGAAPRPRRRHLTRFPGLYDASSAAHAQAVQLAAQTGFPVVYPTMAALGSTYVSDPSTPRAYVVRDRSGRAYRAYRMVVQAPGYGQFYGVQGMTWRNPPILESPDETVRLGGRTYEVFYDGHRVRLVAWRTASAAYWVSNTLLETLTERQMLGIARSLVRLG